MRNKLIAAGFVILGTSLCTLGTPAVAADMCSTWKNTCMGRRGGPACEEKHKTCLKSGCFTEGAKYGGGTHCGLTKK
jgi:hypothetical protein